MYIKASCIIHEEKFNVSQSVITLDEMYKS